ncbi:MAG TPA: polysaccharide biosynthesis tyrosine autokinase [Hymenobacter sp.]|jgi:capsular exopolysaccharide synthesis family protein|uniref:GumC family protein n=1 Tax=Hymenobacter sp. TaxID=1898978 RepID=UPI002EDA149E
MATEMFPLNAEQPNAKSLNALFAGYLRYWYWFLLGVAIAVGSTFLYLRYLSIPQFYVSSTALIKNEKTSPDLPGLGGSSASSIGAPGKSIDDEIEFFKSKTLMLRVVNELSLNTSYYIQGRFKDVEMYEKNLPIKLIINKLDSTAYDKSVTVQLAGNNSFNLGEHTGRVSKYEFGQQISRPYGTFTIVSMPGYVNFRPSDENQKKIIIHFRNPHDLVDQFVGGLTVAPVKKEGNVLAVGLVDALPERGRAVINQLMEDYNKEALEDKNRTATSTIRFLDDRLASLTSELTGVEKNVEQYKQQNEVADVTTQANTYVAQASENNRQLSEWATQIDVLESIESYLKQGSGQSKLVPSSLGIQDPTLLGLIGKFNELQLERERMLRTTEPGNMLVVTMDEQIGNLRANILENLRNIKNSLVITSNNLKATSRQFSSRIRNVPVIEREIGEINRQQAIKQNIYAFLLQKREEAGMTLASNISNLRVIDSAAALPYPVSPNKTTMYLMSLLAGLLVPFGGIYLRDLFNDKVQTRQDVEQLTRTPILGELAHNTDGTVTVTKHNRSAAAETFRFIRASLSFAAGGRENKVLLITSGVSGEGKTFFSINLGASLVLAGERVVVVEMDLRQPALSQELDLSAGPGLTEYLVSNDVSVHDIVKTSNKVPGLMVVSSGPLPPNPAELMMSPKLAHLIAELRLSFDHVIIDTAPVGLVADALGLSSLVDSSLYLVRHKFTYKKRLAIIDNIYRNNLLPHAMIVLNDADGKDTYGYGYGYGYGQQSGKKSKKPASVGV